jgi:hypothetical protein
LFDGNSVACTAGAFSSNLTPVVLPGVTRHTMLVGYVNFE